MRKALCQLQAQIGRLAVAHHLDCNSVLVLLLGVADGVHNLVRRCYLVAIDPQDDIARLHAAIVGMAARRDLINQHT